MLAAVRAALAVRARHGIEGVATEAQLDAAIAAAGLDLRQDRPYKGRIKGRLYRRTVCVRGRLGAGERRVVKAHELGHALLGHADGFYLEALVGGDVPDSLPEAEAQVFAFAVMVGQPAPTAAGLTAQMHVGYDAGVPLSFLCTGISILARTGVT